MTIAEELAALDDPTEGSMAELVTRLRDARAIAAQFNELSTVIELEIAARMEGDNLTVPHVGHIRRVPQKRSQWKDEDSAERFRDYVAETVVRVVALDLASGEVDITKRNIARATIGELYDIIPSFSDVKARGKRMGIDVSEFRTVSYVDKIEFDLDAEAQ